MNKTIKNIVILGGGTSGWLSASMLNQALNKNSGNPCKITLIESSNIGTIGVGEATIHTLPVTFKYLEIPESEWMVKCNATFKMAIKFVNWLHNTANDIYWHPLDRFPTIPGLVTIPLFHYWLKRRFQGNNEPFDYSCFEAVELCDAKKSPRSDQKQILKPRQMTYGYHLDAGLLATFLKEKGKSQGINHIVDHVLDVSLDQRGFIEHLVTENHGNIAGELFIDCSGFRGRLINETLGESFISYSDCLFCDSAVALPVSYPSEDPYNETQEGINSYTTSTALSNGWVWHTPLVERSGNGYVYSSAFISPEDAEKELRHHLNAYSGQARHLKMRVGRNQNAWVKNCISIGLSSGFIEPLESTGIYLIEMGLYNLIENFPDLNFEPYLMNNYNQTMQSLSEDIRDFIVMHYCLTQREDTDFWKANKYHNNIPDSLQYRLDRWRNNWPKNGFHHQPVFRLFPDYSYLCILAGMNYLPENSLPILEYENDLQEEFFAKIRQASNQLQQILPSHIDYLKSLTVNQSN
jgi:tryptophan halogenase